jgi:hypothetical protein
LEAPNIGQIALQVPLKASAPPNITVIIVATYLLERAGAHPAVSSSKAYLPNLVAVSKVVSKKADTVKAPKAIPVCSGNPRLAKKLPIPWAKTPTGPPQLANPSANHALVNIAAVPKAIVARRPSNNIAP